MSGSWTPNGWFARLGVALTVGFLFAWPSHVEAAAVYYSVGTSVADLKTAGTQMTIAAGVATFDRAQPNIVGVGDQITYPGPTIAFISGRTNSTQYSVITRLGVAPANVGAPVAVTSILRAFNSLSVAEANSTNGTHLGTADLVTGNFQLNWPCYNDGVMTNNVRILGYTTDATRYIRVYTPTSSNEVGVSQRHSGVFGTGFQIGATNAQVIQATDNYVRIEGLVIQATVTNNTFYAGIWSDPTGASDVRISHNLIKGVITGGVTGGPAGIEVGTAGGGQAYRVWNNVVYDFNTSGGIGIDFSNGTVYVFNNTVFNCATGIAKNSNVTGEVRNNVSINDALNAAFVDYFQLAGPPAVTRSSNVSSDATSTLGGGCGTCQINKTAYASYFQNTGAGDFHLLNTSLVLWTANGTDLSAHANLPVTNDIDGGPRVRPDIGADELAAVPVYYSVGTTAGPLYSANAQATSGTLTLASAAANNVGVGDEVRIGVTAPRYYITGRTSATVFTIQDSAASGGTPGATNITFASTAITIRRAFNLLTTAESSSSNASHLNTLDLVTGNFQLNWPCYNDAPMNDQVTIGGYITSVNNYIKVYTPVYANQVGASQRHTGKARTGFRLQPTSAVDNDTVHVFDAFVRIEGIEIDGSLSGASNGAGGVWLETVALSPVDHYVSHNIIYETRNFTGIAVSSMSAKVWNNVLFRVNNLLLGALSMDQAGGTGYFYNNTVYDHAGHGINRNAGTMIARNNVSMMPGGGFFDFNGTPTQSYNVSSDATATGTGSKQNMTSYATYFASTTVGAEDLHLRNTSLSLWTGNGTDLSADANLPVTNDIDGGSRVRPDMGADEFTAIILYRSVGNNGGAALASGGGSNALSISGSTATFGAALANPNIGVGDVIQYNANGALAFIHGRSNSQVFTVKDKAGNPPTAVAGDTGWFIYRAYRSLNNWQFQNENASIVAGLRDFDVPAGLNLVTANTVMAVACYADANDTTTVLIDGWTTDAGHYISIFTPYLLGHVGATQRHTGTWASGGYALVTNVAFFGVLDIRDDYVRVTGLRIENTHAEPAGGADQVLGIQSRPNAPFEVQLSHNIIRATGSVALNAHNWTDSGLYQYSDGGVLKAWNNIIYGFGSGIAGEYINTSGTYVLYNNTIANYVDVGIYFQGTNVGVYRWANNLVQGTGGWGGNYYTADLQAPGLDYSSTNLSQDASAPAAVGGGGAPVNGVVAFVGAPDYHLSPGDTSAKDRGTNLSADPNLAVFDDIDGQLRQVLWDIGADDASGTTAVKLMSFEAVAADAAVDLRWQTGSELDNLGFHVYRGLSEGGPWTRLSTSLIPGLGSSAVGRAYSFRDAGLVNGTRYFYRLDDVDASSKVTSHGPVSAVPAAGAAGGAPGSEPPTSGAQKKAAASLSCPDWVVTAYGSMAGGSASATALRCTRHGDPEVVSLSVVSRDARQATLELRTGGFYALHTLSGAGEASGKVRVFVPGFDSPQDPQAPALPFRRALVDAVVGRRTELGGVRALDQVGFRGLVPASLGKAEMQVSQDGTVRAGRRAVRESLPQHVSLDLARLLPSVFQGEVKSAVVQLAPLRWDARRQQIVLAKRLLVKLLFTGRETGESGRGSFGRRAKPPKPVAGELLARIYTTGRGLYAVSFEQLFPGRPAALASSQLRLERQGQAQAFHIAPVSDTFGPGSVLYFHADTTVSSTDFSPETAWELLRAQGGVRMPLVSARPSGAAVTTTATARASFETNRFYQPGLLEAPDPWLWEAVPSGATRAKSFSLGGVDATASQPFELEVFLQGASESGNPVDHHVSVSLNGTLVGEAQFAGKTPYRMSLSVAPSVLRDGANELSLTNVADTGVSSFVFLDRFTVSYPQASSLATGVFEGTWAGTGTATVTGTSGAVALLDVTATLVPGASPPTPVSSTGASWLTGYESAGSALRFRAEGGHRYLAVSQQALLSPRVAVPAASSLRSTTNQADYLLIAPRDFLAAAEPLLQRRHDQGLATRAIAFEEIADEFGHGQLSAEAIQSFLSFAFQSWARPSPRYVLLLGDSSYDPRNFTGTSQPSPLPALWTKTSYLWTVSDPQLAAVNGEDALPDIAIGRLPATTVEEARMLVEKLLAWEESGQGLTGQAALVADNPDIAGDFEQDVRDVADSFLPGRSDVLLLRELGAHTRPRIQDALNAGLSFLSYVGHGGAAVWASENVWNSWDAPSLQAQSQQPLLVTMNCLNGYFVAPAFDSLAESLLKIEGRGAIAAFSPSGLSLDGPAHQYHRALMAEITSGQHDRLGDAVLAAQKAYAQTGLMPELLSVYHLLGDPGMRIR